MVFSSYLRAQFKQWFMTNFKLAGDRCGSAVINAVVGYMHTAALHTIYTAHCSTLLTIHTAHCMLHTIHAAHCIVYSVYCILYILHTAHYTLRSEICKNCILQCTQYITYTVRSAYFAYCMYTKYIVYSTWTLSMMCNKAVPFLIIYDQLATDGLFCV